MDAVNTLLHSVTDSVVVVSERADLCKGRKFVAADRRARADVLKDMCFKGNAPNRRPARLEAAVAALKVDAGAGT